MNVQIYDDRPCKLGEGPLWHPKRQQFFWFDIIARKLLTRDAEGPKEWEFDRMASAAGWIDPERLLIATETGLSVFDLRTGKHEEIAAIEADNRKTRSNDGRADRQGGFWIGTMGKGAEPGLGAIYRYYRGEVRQLVEGITITNAICFSPDGGYAYYADTDAKKIWRQGLDPSGWPQGERELFLDLAPEGLKPDGAVTDSSEAICVACWGAGAVIRFSPDGQRLDSYEVAGLHSSCPAFGGSDLRDLLITTARQGMSDADENQGLTYLTRSNTAGLPEPQIIL